MHYVQWRLLKKINHAEEDCEVSVHSFFKYNVTKCFKMQNIFNYCVNNVFKCTADNEMMLNK